VEIATFETMCKKVGLVAALNAHFAAHGRLPDQRFPGEFHEAVGLPELDEQVETLIKRDCER